MAIFHLSVKTVSRAAGRSAVAAAAYRSGEKLYDERCGLEHDYTRKGGVERGAGQFILAPEGADWAQDRSALWNGAERSEVRKNATVAREYELALPAELGARERAQLVRDFGGELVARYGVAVDVSIHRPERQGDQRNWHAHVLTTTREVGPEGFGAKTRVLDAKATGPAEVEQLRGSWAAHVNRALERARSPERVDHRSYARREIEQEPTTHLGPRVTAMERRALREERPEVVKARGREGMGIQEVLDQPGRSPATERGRANAGVAMVNRFREAARTLERDLRERLARGLERFKPGLNQVAALLQQERQAGLAAAVAGPGLRGLGEMAEREQAARAAERQRREPARERAPPVREPGREGPRRPEPTREPEPPAPAPARDRDRDGPSR